MKKEIKDINDIKNDIIELNNLIDKKCIEIYEINNINDLKITKYKLLIENIIIEYHKICKEIYK